MKARVAGIDAELAGPAVTGEELAAAVIAGEELAASVIAEEELAAAAIADLEEERLRRLPFVEVVDAGAELTKLSSGFLLMTNSHCASRLSWQG